MLSRLKQIVEPGLSAFPKTGIFEGSFSVGDQSLTSTSPLSLEDTFLQN